MTYVAPKWEVEITMDDASGSTARLSLRGKVTDQGELDQVVAVLLAVRPMIPAQVGRSGEAIDPATQIAGSTEGEHAVGEADAPNLPSPSPPEITPHD